MSATAYETRFGSLQHYDKGGVQTIADDVKNYAFSNCFEIANASRPYERIVFGLNQGYVLEVVRTEGESPWFTCAHDEFALVMDGEVEVHLARPDAAQSTAAADTQGASRLDTPPGGPRMG